MKFRHQKFLDNQVLIPGSKSHFQRIALIILAFRFDEIKVANIAFCNDDKSAIAVLESFGYKVEILDKHTLFSLKSFYVPSSINIGESGFLARSLLAICSIKGYELEFVAEGSLLKRDFSHEIDFLQNHAVISSSRSKFPIKISGKLNLSDIEFDSSNSSQFLSGLLIGLASENYSKTLNVQNAVSKRYIDLTVQSLRQSGTIVEHLNYSKFNFLSDNSELHKTYNVESDWSSASFWIVAGVISNNFIINGLNKESYQADKSILNLLDKINIEYSWNKDELHINQSNFDGFEFDASGCPDLIPILTLLAFIANSQSKIIGINRLTNKESNRKTALINEFSKIGGIIEENNNLFIIQPSKLTSGSLSSHNDHRLAMTFIIASITNRLEIEIDDVNCIAKSYPQFLNHFKSLGGIIE